MTALVVAALAVLAALTVGVALTRRSGTVRPARRSVRTELLAAAGVTAQAPTILHFSAAWCGPCAAVRRVVGQVVDDLAGHPRPPVEVELDIDEHPTLAKELGVLSLPTTFVFDGLHSEAFRISGVPAAAELRATVSLLSA